MTMGCTPSLAHTRLVWNVIAMFMSPGAYAEDEGDLDLGEESMKFFLVLVAVVEELLRRIPKPLLFMLEGRPRGEEAAAGGGHDGVLGERGAADDGCRGGGWKSSVVGAEEGGEEGGEEEVGASATSSRAESIHTIERPRKTRTPRRTSVGGRSRSRTEDVRRDFAQGDATRGRLGRRVTHLGAAEAEAALELGVDHPQRGHVLLVVEMSSSCTPSSLTSAS